ncbi:MAG: hypothetical protein AB7E49_03385 [Campylobacterales bacterium]
MKCTLSQMRELAKELPEENDWSWWVENQDNVRLQKKEVDRFLRLVKKSPDEFFFLELAENLPHNERNRFKFQCAAREAYLLAGLDGHDYIHTARETASGFEVLLCVSVKNHLFPEKKPLKTGFEKRVKTELRKLLAADEPSLYEILGAEEFKALTGRG